MVTESQPKAFKILLFYLKSENFENIETFENLQNMVVLNAKLERRYREYKRLWLCLMVPSINGWKNLKWNAKILI